MRNSTIDPEIDALAHQKWVPISEVHRLCRSVSLNKWTDEFLRYVTKDEIDLISFAVEFESYRILYKLDKRKFGEIQTKYVDLCERQYIGEVDISIDLDREIDDEVLSEDDYLGNNDGELIDLLFAQFPDGQLKGVGIEELENIRSEKCNFFVKRDNIYVLSEAIHSDVESKTTIFDAISIPSLEFYVDASEAFGKFTIEDKFIRRVIYKDVRALRDDIERLKWDVPKPRRGAFPTYNNQAAESFVRGYLKSASDVTDAKLIALLDEELLGWNLVKPPGPAWFRDRIKAAKMSIR